MIKFIDLCAGIGGGRLGLEKNGFKCVGFSEILETSIKSYKAYYDTSNEKDLGDLTKLKYEEIPDCEMLIAGFPCQSFSIQGLRKGFEDERGQIIFYIAKIIKEKNIKYFMLENVKGLVHHNNGETLKAILTLLDETGYNVYWKVLKSNDYGLPQKRERIYFVGIRKDLENTFYTFPTPLQEQGKLKDFLINTDEKYIYNNYDWFNRYLINKYNQGKYKLEDILKEDYLIIDTRQSDIRFYRDYIPTLRTGRSGLLYVKDGKIRKISGRESLLLQGFGLDIYNKSKDFTNGKLLEQTGNAMSVKVIEEVAKELKSVMIKNGDM